MEPAQPPGDLTQWLLRWSRGDAQALDRLMPAVYDQLRRLAGAQLRRERSDHTLEAAGLVNEAYLRLLAQRRMRCRDRGHFFSIASCLMRRVLVDHARSRRYAKRGGGRIRCGTEMLEGAVAEMPGDWPALHDALAHLRALDAGQARIVELHFFEGLTLEEIAVRLGVSVPTIVRRWRSARAFLYRALDTEGAR
ncbi:MAG: ECF-type sigma factor [Vicinamibacteria bacterium]